MGGSCATIGCPHMGAVLHSKHAGTLTNKKPDGMDYLPSWRCNACSKRLIEMEKNEKNVTIAKMDNDVQL